MEPRWWEVGVALACLVLLGLLVSSGRARAARDGWTPKVRDDAALAEVVRKVARKHRQPAMAVALVHQDRIVAQAAVGTTVEGGGRAVEPDSRFHLGSTTKGITSLLIALLVRDGRLSYDSTIPELLPELPMRDEYRQVTVRDLLLHRSGVMALQERDKEDPALMARLWDELPAAVADPREQRMEMARIALSQPPRDPVGTRHVYSNVGYCLLGLLAESAGGAPFEALVRTRIFEPLGMTTARLGGWPASPGDPDQPRGHYVDGGTPRPQPLDDPYTFPAWMNPAGGVHCSIGDYARYARETLRGLQGRGELLERAGYIEIHTAHTTTTIGDMYAPSIETLRAAYGPGVSKATVTLGYGWGIASADDGPVSLGDGSGGTFFARVAVFPALDAALVAVTSAGSGSPAIEDAAKRITGLRLQ